MYQANNADTVAARLDELLVTIEQSASELRTYLQQKAQHTQTPDHTNHVGLSGADDTSPTHLYSFYDDASVASNAFLLKMTCERLITLVTPPQQTVMEQSSSFFTTAAMKIILDHDVAQHVHVLCVGTQGAPLAKVAEAAKLDAELLGRILRYLSQKGIFQEDNDDSTRYRNTTASSTLVNDPEFKAFMSLVTTEVYNGSTKLGTYMEEKYRYRSSNIQGGINSKAEAELHGLPSPFNMYTGLPFYQWLHQPENAVRSQNFNQAMRGLARCETFSSIPLDYPFNGLPVDTTIVDVGGGIGALAEMILPECPHLHMVVQDLEPVIKSAVEKPSDAIKTLMDDGRLRFEAQNFLEDQKEDKKGNVFLICNVLLNQSDDASSQILKCIRKSDPSKLIIIDRFYGPFFQVEADTPEGERKIYRSIRNASRSREVTMGRPGSHVVTAVFDMIMASMFVTKTRTREQWAELLAKAGYALVEVTPIRASSGHMIIEARIWN